jgi:hypothetical protein
VDKQLVVVARKWHEPMIRVDVTEIGVGVTMTLEDFVLALETESGAELLAAAERVIRSVKRETSKIM